MPQTCRPSPGSTPTCSTPTATAPILSPANQQTGGQPGLRHLGRAAPVGRPVPRRSPSRRSTSASVETGYVVADTAQREVDYSTTNGNTVSSHYSGHRRGADRLVLGQGCLRPPFPRPQPAHLELDHAEIAADVPPGRPRSGRQGGALPHRRQQPVPGDRQRPASTGSSTPTRRRATTRMRSRRSTSELPSGSGSTGSLQLRPQLGEGRRQRLHGQHDVLRRHQAATRS